MLGSAVGRAGKCFGGGGKGAGGGGKDGGGVPALEILVVCEFPGVL